MSTGKMYEQMWSIGEWAGLTEKMRNPGLQNKKALLVTPRKSQQEKDYDKYFKRFASQLYQELKDSWAEYTKHWVEEAKNFEQRYEGKKCIKKELEERIVLRTTHIEESLIDSDPEHFKKYWEHLKTFILGHMEHDIREAVLRRGIMSWSALMYKARPYYTYYVPMRISWGDFREPDENKLLMQGTEYRDKKIKYLLKESSGLLNPDDMVKLFRALLKKGQNLRNMCCIGLNGGYGKTLKFVISYLAQHKESQVVREFIGDEDPGSATWFEVSDNAVSEGGVLFEAEGIGRAARVCATLLEHDIFSNGRSLEFLFNACIWTNAWSEKYVNVPRSVLYTLLLKPPFATYLDNEGNQRYWDENYFESVILPRFAFIPENQSSISSASQCYTRWRSLKTVLSFLVNRPHLKCSLKALTSFQKGFLIKCLGKGLVPERHIETIIAMAKIAE